MNNHNTITHGRTHNAIRNASTAFIAQFLISLTEFVVRTIFIYTLGNTYLGLNGLFSDILTLLSLAELGFGTAITYALYEPLAHNNEPKVAALLMLFKRIYNFLGVFITAIGLLLTPFLSFFISDMPDIPELPFIYILYLCNTSFSYFLVYKKSLLNANQSSHIVSFIQIVTSGIMYIFQVLVLLLFRNFILFLSIQVFCTLLNNIIISFYVSNHYRYLKIYKNQKISTAEKKAIFTNVKAMFLSKISSAVVTSTDNILISKFVSTIVLGFYSNYTWFTTFIRAILNKIFEAISGSIGNLLSLESKEKAHDNYLKIWFVNYWMICFFTVFLFVNVNPFIRIWVGNKYTLNMLIVFTICLNLYMRFIRNTSLTYLDAYGVFTRLKLKCIAEAIINLVVSLIYLLVFDMGIFGVLLGTFTSNMLTNFWFEPYVLYKDKFKAPLIPYFLKFAQYFSAMMLNGAIVYFVINRITFSNIILTFIVQVIVSFILINIIIIILFFRTKEFKYLMKCLFSK